MREKAFSSNFMLNIHTSYILLAGIAQGKQTKADNILEWGILYLVIFKSNQFIKCHWAQKQWEVWLNIGVHANRQKK